MSGPDRWRIENVGSVTLVRSANLGALDGLVHAFSTRLGGAGRDLDMGKADAAARRAFIAAAGLGAGEPAPLRQVHAADVVRAAEIPIGQPARADAVFALERDRPCAAPAVRSADCVPILIADRGGRAVAAVHAGWRGTAAGVASRAVERLGRHGVAPGRLLAALGPAIGPCCYEVGPEVLAAVARATGGPPEAFSRPGGRGRAWLDLRRANTLQLLAAGLPGPAIESAPWCTACSGDLFFSHRRDGSLAGRMMACIGWGAP